MLSRIKIVYVIPTLDMNEGGGILEFLYLLVKYLDHNYYQVDILVFYSSQADSIAFEEVGATVHIAFPRKENNTYLSLFKWLSEKMRALRPQIVHTNIYWADTLGREVAFKCGIPVVITTAHSATTWESDEQKAVKKKLLLKTDAVICNTYSVKSYSVEVDNIDEAMIQVIPCAFNIDRYATGIADIAGLSKRCYSVGRLVEAKNPLGLITAFADVVSEDPECKLICIGDGPLRDECQLLVESLNMRDVIFMAGYKGNPFKSVEPGSVFILNSSNEGQGIVLLEAMAQGLICIAPDCDGIPEVITHEVNGFLFKMNDAEALKATIRQVLSMDLNFLNQIRRSAYEEVLEKFNPKKMSDRYAMVYERLLKSKLSYAD